MKADNVGMNQLEVVSAIKSACWMKDFMTAHRLIILITDPKIADKLKCLVGEWEFSVKEKSK